MVARIGVRLIEGIKPREKRYRIQDSELNRFFLRVEPSGRMTYGCDVVLPSGRRSTVTIGRHGMFTPAQARGEAMKILGDIARGIDPTKKKSGTMTLKSFVDEEWGPWFKARNKKGRADTEAEIKAGAEIKMVEHSFKSFLAKPLKEITPHAVEKWKTELLNAGKKPATVNRKMDALRAALFKAINWGFLDLNPLSKVEWCQVDDNSVVRYLSDDEAGRLEQALAGRDKQIRIDRKQANLWRSERGYKLHPDLEAVPFVDHLRPLINLSRNLGVRRGELFRLKLSDVNFQQKIVAVFGKNGKTRYVPLNALAFQTLSDWVRQNNIEAGLLFRGACGGALNNVNTSWENLLEQAGIKDFRWHDMRHDFASRLVMKGVDLNTVRDLLGHADIKMTLRYAHLAPHVKADAVSKLD